MANSHTMRHEAGVKICGQCGAALHRNGDWWLAGKKSKVEPPCGPDWRDWYLSAIDNEATKIVFVC